MIRSRYGSLAVVLAALVVGTAWVVGKDPARTDPAPVDVLLEATSEAEVPEATPGSSIFVAAPHQPRTEWDLPATMNDRVQYWIDFLKGRNYEKTRVWLEREGRYGEFIRGKLRERGMPEDLLYLGMIESGLSNRAYSRAHASGMWQFIAETGRRYGLEVTPYVDERRDPIEATDAALTYLSEMYDDFGSWFLAAAGYNSGENRVARLLRQRAGGKTGDENLFWAIDGYLPRETRDYVPLMLAAAFIAKDPERYGFANLQYQEPLSFEEVEVPGGVTLRAVAQAGSVDLEEVEDLNPHLVRGVTPPGKSWRVRVPAGHGGAVAANLDKIAESERLASVEHLVRRGETLSHIARRYGVGLDAITSANRHVNPRRLQVGERVHVPVLPGSQARVASAKATSSASQPSWTTYRVRRGDTLWEIARRHGVSVNEIKRWNGIGSRIYPGQRLRLQA